MGDGSIPRPPVLHPNPDLMNPGLWGKDPGTRALVSPPGNCAAHSTVRSTVLEDRDLGGKQ